MTVSKLITKNKRSLKVLLVNPGSMPHDESEEFFAKKSILRTPSFSMPIGLMDLASWIRFKMPSCQIKLIDYGAEYYRTYLKGSSRRPTTNLKFHKKDK